MRQFLPKFFLSYVLICILAASLGAQNRQGYMVKGSIIDANGPVIGATVMEQNTSNGVSTGMSGEYTLTASGPAAIIEVSCIGYATQTFKASEVPSVITLLEDSEFIEDAVIIGYGTVKKSDMTGSVVAIRAEEINRGAVSTPDQLLLGKVAGLRIIPGNGQDNSTGTLRIRGAASLSANNDPLIIIDGVMGSTLGSLNPDDIESFSILKDASATAIYGSRASNGVVIISTKRGGGGKPTVTYNGSISAKSLTGFYEWMDGDELRSFINSTYPEKASYLGTENTDFMKLVYRTGINTDHNVSVRGGGKLPYRVSLGYNYNTPNSKVGRSNRFNFNATLSPVLFDKHLSITANVKVNHSDAITSRTSAIGGALSFNPTVPAYDENGNIWNWRNTDGSAVTNSTAPYSPLSTLYDNVGYSNSTRLTGSLQASYKVHGFEDLSFNVNASTTASYSDSRSWAKLDSFTYERSSNPLANLSFGWGNRTSLLETYANYQHDFKNSNLSLMAGYSWNHYYIHSNGTAQYYNKEPRFQEQDIYQEAIPSSSELYLISFFGRANYSIKSRYLFTFTIREDASSRFGPTQRWGLFPSAAFAWNLAEEPFIKRMKNISTLKFRLSWGKTGQQDIGSDYYAYLARYNRSTSDSQMLYNMGGNTLTHTLAPSAYNPNIKWETTDTYNVALDWGVNRERVTGSIEAYYRYTYDLLNTIDVPLGSNFSNVVTSNIGNLLNKGLEFSVNAVAIQTKDWNWVIGGNLTFQDTKITKLTAVALEDYLGVQVGSGLGGTGGYSSLHSVGYSPYTFYLYHQLYDKDGEPIQNGLVDTNGDGIINDSDRYLTGLSPTPWMFFGFNTRVSYKRWDFSVNGHGSVGNYIINTARSGAASSYSNDYTLGYVGNINKELLMPGWTNPSITEQGYSDYWVENASFLKVDDINLGYTFRPNRIAKSIRVAASLQNVLTITKFRGQDPETTSLDGVDGSSFPRPRFYTLRLNINF